MNADVARAILDFYDSERSYVASLVRLESDFLTPLSSLFSQSLPPSLPALSRALSLLLPFTTSLLHALRTEVIDMGSLSSFGAALSRFAPELSLYYPYVRLAPLALRDLARLRELRADVAEFLRARESLQSANALISTPVARLRDYPARLREIVRCMDAETDVVCVAQLQDALRWMDDAAAHAEEERPTKEFEVKVRAPKKGKARMAFYGDAIVVRGKKKKSKGKEWEVHMPMKGLEVRVRKRCSVAELESAEGGKVVFEMKEEVKAQLSVEGLMADGAGEEASTPRSREAEMRVAKLEEENAKLRKRVSEMEMQYQPKPLRRTQSCNVIDLQKLLTEAF